MKTTADIAVVGAGMIGIFHALFLAERGRKVVLIDQGEQPSGSSVQNFGIISTNTLAPLEGRYRNYAEDSWEIYDGLARSFPLPLYKNGSLYLATTPAEHDVLKEMQELMQQRFVPSFLLGKKDVMEVFPLINDVYAQSGLYLPDDFQLNPKHLIHNLLEILKEGFNVEIIQGEKVIELGGSNAGCTLKTDKETLVKVNKTILCTGYNVNTLYPDFFGKKKLKLVKLRMMRSKPLEKIMNLPNLFSGWSIARFPAFKNCPSYDQLKAQTKPIFAKLHGIHIIIKQEDDGSLIIGDSHEYFTPENGTAVSNEANDEIDSFILDEALKMLNINELKITDKWNGFYLQTDSGDYINEEVDTNVRVVTGIGGSGMTLGPGFARENVQTYY